MAIQVTEGLLDSLRKRPKAARKEIGDAMNRVAQSWGQPHLHGGIGIRRLTKSIYECRVGLDDRLAFLFVTKPPELEFFFLGNHDEIKRLIKSRG